MWGVNARQRGLVDYDYLNANMPGSKHLAMSVDMGVYWHGLVCKIHQYLTLT